MYYSYVEIEYVATSFSPARMELAVKLLRWDTAVPLVLFPEKDIVWMLCVQTQMAVATSGKAGPNLPLDRAC